MDLARRRSLPVREPVLIRHDLYVCDECFVTGTAAEIVPIVEIDKRPVGDGRPGPITQQLIKDFAAYRTAG
jgi:branched-chain amino acid aminotransferase